MEILLKRKEEKIVFRSTKYDFTIRLCKLLSEYTLNLAVRTI